MGRRNGVKISPTRREQIFSNLPYRCYYCLRSFNKDVPPTMDHIIPVCRGGSNHPQNIALSCEKCNTNKGYRTAVEYFANMGYARRARRGLLKTDKPMNCVYAVPCHHCGKDFLSKNLYNRFCDKYCRTAFENRLRPAQAPIFAALSLELGIYL